MVKQCKLWILKKILFYWDVFFTIIDNWQLRKYVKLRNYIDDLQYESIDTSGENWRDWDDVV